MLPLYPACVAQIASSACSPSRLSSVTRRSAADVDDFAIVICIEPWPVCCGALKANAAAVTVSARIENRATEVFKFFKIEPPSVG